MIMVQEQVETRAFDIGNVLTITNCIDISKPLLYEYKPIDSTTIMDLDSDFDEEIEEIADPEEREYSKTYKTDEKKNGRILKYALKWNDEDAIGFEYKPLPWDTKDLIGCRIRIKGPVEVMHRIGLLTKDNCELIESSTMTGNDNNNRNSNNNNNIGNTISVMNTTITAATATATVISSQGITQQEIYDLVEDDLLFGEENSYDLVDDNLLFDV